VKLLDEAIKAREEILNIFNAKTSDEAIRRLAILVEKRHTLPWMAQGVVNRLVSKIEGLFQYLDHDIPKTSNQAEQTFSLFQPIIETIEKTGAWVIDMDGDKVTAIGYALRIKCKRCKCSALRPKRKK